MATGGDAVQAARDATRETARLGVSTVVEGVATGIIEIGSSTPFVAPLCVALLKAKGIVDEASRNEEELKELCERCDLITVRLIDKAKTLNASTIDVKPLQKCIDKLKVVAERYGDQGCSARLARFAQFRRDGDDIQRLRTRLEAVVQTMILAGVVDIGARQQPRPKLAPVPNKAPVTKSFHVVRDGVRDRVCNILGDDEGPKVVALTGRGGAGKTTSAAAIVGERGPIRPRTGETEDQARARLDRVRARFSDGVVWLRVGKGGGAASRLPGLMLTLAKMLHEDVMKGGVHAPEVSEDGESYVRNIVEQEKLRCLVVADDVWESSVVQKLRGTGMWVLLTTRFSEMVEPTERVVMDTLTETEAGAVLRGAAEIPSGESLCDAAKEVLKICGRVAMDIAFVGSWSTVRSTNGKPKSSKAWANTASQIESQIAAVRGEVGNDPEMNDVDVHRLAVLRTGFKYLGQEDALAQELYAALAVFPDGHSFVESDAAALLNDEEAAAGAISTLERWGVLKADASHKYRMHDAHVEFAWGKLMSWEDVRKPAVDRWTSRISRLVFAISIDVYTLVNVWRAIEKVGGEGWLVRKPYADQLIGVDATDQLTDLAVHVVAELYIHDQSFVELDAILAKVLEKCKEREGGCSEVRMAALFYMYNSFHWQGRDKQRDDVYRRLGELGDSGVLTKMSNESTGVLQTSTTFVMYGVCAIAAGRSKEAEECFRKALRVQEGDGRGSYQISWAMLHLGYCVREAGRPLEAEELFKRALKIQEAKWGPDHPHAAMILYEMGVCARENGPPGKAEELFKRVLKIEEAKWGADHLQVAWSLHEVGRCAREAGRPREAKALLQRALEIKEANLEAEDPHVAVTLHEIGQCARETGELGEAGDLFQRALEIREAKLGPDDLEVAYTLREMGRCMREAGRPGEAEALFRRVLEIQKAKLEDDDTQVACTLQDMGLCVQQVGRPEDATELFKRALTIRQAKMGPDVAPCK